MADIQEKIELLRYCVEAEGDGGIASLDWRQRKELEEFLDQIEENAEAFVTLMKLIGEVER